MNAENTTLQAMSAHRGWLLALGIVLFLLGLIGLGATFTLTIATVTFFGVLFIIGGIVQFVEAIRLKSTRNPVAEILIALLYFIGGIIIIRHPLLASVTFTLFIAWSLIIIGIFHVVGAVKMRDVGGWVWMLFNGMVDILLGGIIWSHWPVSGLWVIGLFIAIELLLNGWSLMMLSFALRRT